MKKLIVILTLIVSATSFAQEGNNTSSNVVCGVDNISISKIGYATKSTKVAEVMSDFRSEGASVVICNYEDGAAVVASFSNEHKEVIIFKP